MIRILQFILLCTLCFFGGIGVDKVNAQDTLLPFYKEIIAFKKLDSIGLPPSHAILLIGSSSFTKWTDVHNFFPNHIIINRAFGGSSLPDVIRYAKETIFKYQPKQIVIYCGENDLASSDTVTAQMVFQRFKQLFTIIRKNDPAVSVAFVSIKPSPSRRHLWPKVEAANQLIKNYLTIKNKTAFIDVYYPMFNKDRTVMSEIFLDDSLHMNSKGYKIWQKTIKPYLIK